VGRLDARPSGGGFVSARLADGRWFRTLTVLDLFTRESLALVTDRSLTGEKVAAALSDVLRQRPAPTAINAREQRMRSQLRQTK